MEPPPSWPIPSQPLPWSLATFQPGLFKKVTKHLIQPLKKKNLEEVPIECLALSSATSRYALQSKPNVKCMRELLGEVTNCTVINYTPVFKKKKTANNGDICKNSCFAAQPLGINELSDTCQAHPILFQEKKSLSCVKRMFAFQLTCKILIQNSPRSNNSVLERERGQLIVLALSIRYTQNCFPWYDWIGHCQLRSVGATQTTITRTLGRAVSNLCTSQAVIILDILCSHQTY